MCELYILVYPRTTIAIDDDLFKRMKEKAAREGRPFRTWPMSCFGRRSSSRLPVGASSLPFADGGRGSGRESLSSTATSSSTSWTGAEGPAIDTNVLVYAEIVSSEHHSPARRLLTDFVEGPAAWAIPWPCIYEFLRVVTHPRVFSPPVPMDLALSDLRQILAAPTLVVLAETDRHAEVMETIVRDSGVTGNLVHDAHIAALCVEHGISELLTGDRDFARFPVAVKNPFA